LLHSIIITLCEVAIILATCTAIELIAPAESFSVKGRIQGTFNQAILTVFGPLAAWPLQELWISLNPNMVLPMWHWLKPFGLWGWLALVIILVILGDFCSYWRHRAEHRWFWPIHLVHHSARDLHAANSFGHPLQTIPHLLFVGIPMSFIEMGPGVPVAVSFLVLLSGFLIHSPTSAHLGMFRMLFVDNRFHRIHHSLEPRHFEKNFGIFLSFWDRIFGTTYEPGEEWPAVGLADIPPPRSALEYALMPFRRSMILSRLGSSRLPSSSAYAGGEKSEFLRSGPALSWDSRIVENSRETSVRS
jgi:sterol desaturase/sphingolipid hydroxylase (fatty acid hydroxylase superfamily)